MTGGEYRAVRDIVLSVVRVYGWRVAPADVDDVTQDVALGLWRERVPVTMWPAAASLRARSRLVDVFRRAAVRRRVVVAPMSEQPPDPLSALEQRRRAQRERAIRPYIARLGAASGSRSVMRAARALARAPGSNRAAARIAGVHPSQITRHVATLAAMAFVDGGAP